MAFEYKKVWYVKAIVSLIAFPETMWEISKTFPGDITEEEALDLFDQDMQTPRLKELVQVEKVWAQEAEEYVRV